ncbi:MAG: hypothetical protein M3440_04910 [Chloroflexota bacterium]|nr:hypothetical protein [Chloroflexota bacterium]
MDTQATPAFTPFPATIHAVDADSGRLTNITNLTPNHIHGLAEAVRFWCDELALALEVVAI